MSRSSLLAEVRKFKKLANACNDISLKAVPLRWENFSRLTQIRSGAGFIPFEAYDYQIKLSDTIDDHPTTVITKTRQLGISETIISKFIHKALLKPGYLAVVFSRNQADTSNLAKRCRGMIESIPQYAKLSSDSLQQMMFTNGSGILFRNATPNGARGIESVSDILYDEAEFVEHCEEIYKSSIPCTAMLGDDARIIINSTPGKRSGFYFDKLNQNNGSQDIIALADRVKSGELPNQYFTDSSGWAKCILHWRSHPVYSLKDDYLQHVREKFQLDEPTVQQEFNLSFSDSAESVFSPSVVRQACIDTLTKTVNKKASYFFGVDPNASITGKDYFALVVYQELDEKLSIVDYYRKRGETAESHIFSIQKLVDKYSPVTINIESNNSGHIYIEQLCLAMPDVNIEAVKTTASSKPGMISRLNMAMEQETLTLPNLDVFINEFLSFRKIGTKLEAVSGKHDDLVMALAIGLSATGFTGRKTIQIKTKKEINTNNAN